MFSKLHPWISCPKKLLEGAKFSWTTGWSLKKKDQLHHSTTLLTPA